MIRTLIVDDSALVRSIIRDFLESDDFFEVIGEAENGSDGVSQAQLLNPDLITMDIEMPVMNGLQAITEIKKIMSTPIVVISTHDTAKMAYDAVVKGALEFYAKDIFTSRMSEDQREQILGTLKHITGIKGRIPVRRETVEQPVIAARSIGGVVIAASTGGPKALNQLFAGLPKDFPVPVMLVQHNSSGFDRGFVQWLDGYTPLEVCLVEEGTRPARGKIHVAPTDRHLLLGRAGFILDDGEPIHNQKPAADALFKSAAARYGESVISVVLTGMGSDGADGTRYIKQAGGITIAQDESSSMVYGMPRAAAETGCVDLTLPLDAIAERLVFLTKGSAE
ncbi:chemotaxis response regulator protein-glutamate methylesterase [Spirochaetia bacterium]|nr:chemotaxis response regulator protein-glutamate methylesterase [Spirochaetia bacterium]